MCNTCRDLLSPIFLNSTGIKTGLAPFCGSEEKVSETENWFLQKEDLSVGERVVLFRMIQ